MITFDWDDEKASKNLKKHGISFEEAKSVFFDEYAVQFYDESHSQLEEDRFLILGYSNDANLLTICHCEREKGNVIRVTTP